jgi:hypothetical protein
MKDGYFLKLDLPDFMLIGNVFHTPKFTTFVSDKSNPDKNE